MRITQRTLAALKTTSPKGQRFYDSDLRGFGVRVMLDGTKHFEVRYGGRKNRRRLTVGRHGTLTLDQARTKAREILAAAELGGDPAADRKRARELPTFGEWEREYCTRIRGRLKSAAKIESFLKAAEKRWNSRGLDTISAADVEALFQKIGEKHPTAANRFLQSLSPCFAAAVRDGLLRSNPAAGIRHFQENPPRARVLTDDEMRVFLDAVAAEEDPHVRAAFALLVETGARLSEVLRAKWEDLDLDAGLWRLPSPKSGHPQMIPLARSTVAKLRRLPRLGAFVIAGRSTDKPRADLKKPWEHVREKAEIPDVHIHDIRRTFGLHVSRSAGLHVASKLLRHGNVQITAAIYAPLGIEDLRAAVEARAAVLPFASKKKAAAGKRTR